MKNITNFQVDKSDIKAAASSKNFTIEGEPGAEFTLQVFNTPASTSVSRKFYDFVTKSFEDEPNHRKLKVKMLSNTFVGTVDFPANAAGDTYSFLLIPATHKDTNMNLGKGSVGSAIVDITQVIDSRLRFTPITTAASSYEAMPANVDSTSSPISTGTIIKEINWDIENKDNDANGFGLILTRQPIDTDWYFTTTATTYQPVDTGSTTELEVDSLTNLAVGMYITAGTGLSGTPIITAINRDTKTLTLSTAQNLGDDVAITLQARGSNVIKKATGADIDFSGWNADVVSATTEQLTKTIRTAANSATVALNGTRGISGGGVVTVKGLNVINSTTSNTVTTNRTNSETATASAAAGEIILVTAQTTSLKVGTKIYFDGSTLKITVKNNVKINRNPLVNVVIYLNLDNFITPGIQTTGG